MFGMDHMGTGWGGLWMIGIWLIPIVLFVLLLLRWFSDRRREPDPRNEPDARRILDARFARGEIDAEEYEAKKRALER
jgi:putative membrane protein